MPILGITTRPIVSTVLTCVGTAGGPFAPTPRSAGNLLLGLVESTSTESPGAGWVQVNHTTSTRQLYLFKRTATNDSGDSMSIVGGNHGVFIAALDGAGSTVTGAASLVQDTTSPFSVSTPSATAPSAGTDLIIALFDSTSSPVGSINTPAGFTLLANSNLSDPATAIFTRSVSAGATGTTTVTATATGGGSYNLVTTRVILT